MRKSKLNWKKLNDRQVVSSITLDNNKTLFVIAPKDFKKKLVPLFCPLCDFPMISKEDVSSYKKHNLCEKCSYKWEYKNIKKIKGSEEFYEYLEVMKILKRTKLNFK